MTVGEERAHAVQLDECQRSSASKVNSPATTRGLLAVSCAAFGIGLVGMGRQVAEKTQRMGSKARLALRAFNRPIF